MSLAATGGCDMSNRAVGRYALGICDRSGQTFKLKDLYQQIVDGKDSGQFPIGDPQTLPFTRTDTNVVSQRRIAWNWNPVGDNNGLSALYGFSTQTSTQAAGEVGTVTVLVS